MLRTFFIVCILILSCLAHPHDKIGACPDYTGMIQHDHLTVTLDGNLKLTKGQDSLCYNYTLANVFRNRPGIAISVHDLQSESSLDQFFSIKPVRSDSNGVIPFVIRTHWKYTSWTKISFSFFAEDKNNIEAGYYQVDSGSLAGCNTGKDIHVLLPFRTNFKGKNIKTATFLHGFQLTSKVIFENNSPFEVQIINHDVNVTGIAITVSVTTVTQVQSLFISYIAFGSDMQNIFVGNYTYDTYVPTGILTHQPSESLRNTLADFYGFNGFIINNNGNFGLRAAWTGNQFNFTTMTNFRYVNFNYLFLLGSPCSDCPKYPILFNNDCVSYCPTNTNFNGKTCVECTVNQVWNGSQCTDRCSNGRIWNSTISTCVCPVGRSWNGFICIVCPNGRTWNMNTRSCQCPISSTWNGVTCVLCTGGRIYNTSSNLCQCPQNQSWNGFVCNINCPQGQFYNDTIKSCACPSSQFWNGEVCILCFGGQLWNSTIKTCHCPTGNLWNGTSCYDPCNGGRILDTLTQQCICPSGNWNGNACVICPDTQIWSLARLACACKQGNWNGLACIGCSANQVWFPATLSCGCATGLNWNGVNCVSCQLGQNWNPVTRSCGCQVGTNWNGNQCVTCSGGRLWNPANRNCICQNSNWNGYACIRCSPGQTWNQTSLSCSCSVGLFWNGVQCRSCSGQRTWNFQLNNCVCRQGNWNGNQCINCPVNSNWNGKSCVRCDGNRVWNSLTSVCQCPQATQWDGVTCKQTCPSGKILQNGLCVCPRGQFQIEGKCINTPSCQQGFKWDGVSCKKVSCNSGTSYNNSCSCCQSPFFQCPAGAHWDGFRCVYITNLCPNGMSWIDFSCKPINGSACKTDQYELNGKCIPLSSRCPSGTHWVNNNCVPISNTCPTGSYYNGVRCIPYQSCTQGRVWNQTLSQCICPFNAFYNGIECIKCADGQTFSNGGCFCPEGTFFNGTRCQTQTIDTCISIPNSNWNSTHCICQRGYSTNGASCFCQGVVMGDYCQRCASKPNSLHRNGICQCNTGYVQLNGLCVLRTQAVVQCNVGTFFDSQLQKCLPCSDGCLSCKDCYDCSQCRPDYYLHPSGLCIEICGDGKRYTSGCDDGNNNNGDGCSNDCKVQVGFSCYGGSPNSKDLCTTVLPTEISFENRGQSRLFGKAVINVKVNYLPQALLESASECSNNCRSVISASIVKGFQGGHTITARYIPTTSFIFSIEVDFGREPIGQFSIQIGINQNLRAQFFSGVDISRKIVLDVNPAFMSSIDKTDRLQL